MDLIGCDRVQYEEHLQIECECGRTIKKHRMREGDEVVCLGAWPGESSSTGTRTACR